MFRIAWIQQWMIHFMKSVGIRSYSGPHFPAFSLNKERYSASLRIQSECAKMRTRTTLNTDTFYAVTSLQKKLNNKFKIK